MLTAMFRSTFPARIRTAGERYYRQRRARVVQMDDSRLVAEVRGTRRYEVAIRADELGIEGACDCPFFADRGPCKHLWAAILLADATGYLRAARPGGSSGVVDPPDTDSFDDGDPDDDLDRDLALLVDAALGRATAPGSRRPGATRESPWRLALAAIASARDAEERARPTKRLSDVKVYFILDLKGARDGQVHVELKTRGIKQDGTPGKLVDLVVHRDRIDALEDADSRAIVAMLGGAGESFAYGSYMARAQIPKRVELNPTLQALALPAAARAGRLMAREQPDAEPTAIAWDDGPPWIARLHVEAEGRGWILRPAIHRDGESREASPAVLPLPSGLVLADGVLARMEDPSGGAWMRYPARSGPIHVPISDADAFIGELLTAAPGMPVSLPKELEIEDAREIPRPRLQVRPGPAYRSDLLRAEVSFEYAGLALPPVPGSPPHYDAARRRLLHRDPVAEASAMALVPDVGLRRAPGRREPGSFELAARRLPAAVRRLCSEGWHVEADGRLYRAPSAWSFKVTSGVDWFDLEGGASYGGTVVPLPDLLAALAKGDGMVLLSDGSLGMLPEDWLARFGPLASLGKPRGDMLRFTGSQAMLLDALLAEQGEATCDATFTKVRDQLRSFDGVKPATQPRGFRGVLRDYQCAGLGWMDFLRRFGLGGCLADDMGVGKTAQVLALLEKRRAERAKAGSDSGPRTSLVVVPRSLVFNWLEEAARFTPKLAILDASGAGRDFEAFGAHDIVLVTYGTLRRDAARLREIPFDYAILDEAQAIKNAASTTAKAARLLDARHRLALSGTPIENHLGELWSLFEFLNPGMLGAASVFGSRGGLAKADDSESRALLARALRPFILRRTKQHVAKELPARTEQEIRCELGPEQRRIYDDLRDHYRSSLLSRIDTKGMAKSKMHVLEALLRLRQAACHPALIDKRRTDAPSAKLETLLARLGETCDEGHRALVFSQFTSFLAIVRKELDARGIAYEYLDGQTRDRRAAVARFQDDESCKLFLISLKAGGMGLNLTSADYVFLLDPWWNPAVEAQAIDRAHRIGQVRPVIAYRLIAQDTIEEKVLALQASKRELAAAIIGQDASVLKTLGRDDLELLLS